MSHATWSPRPRVCFLLERGTPPRLNPIFAEVFERLEGRGVRVSARYPEEELWRLDRLAVEADLYVLKSDTELALSLALALERLGARVLNRASASLLAKNKVLAAAVLTRAGLPAPRSLTAGQPAQLAGELAQGPLILKAHRGYHGAGVAVAASAAELPSADAYPDLTFAQDYLAGWRTDLKVFGIGDDVFGVRKTFGADSYRRAGEPVELSPAARELARRCARAFDLELYGLDLAERVAPTAGPAAEAPALAVIDVNYLPGYRGVPDAARRIAEYVAGQLGGRAADQRSA